MARNARLPAVSPPRKGIAAIGDSNIVHILDEDCAARDAVVQLLHELGFTTRSYSAAAQFLTEVTDNHRGCLILELSLSELDGFAIIACLRRRPRPLPVIVLTKEADVSRVVRAYQTGIVVHFLEKHLVRVEELKLAIERAHAIDARQCFRHQTLETRFTQMTMLEEALHSQPGTSLNCRASSVISFPATSQVRQS